MLNVNIGGTKGWMKVSKPVRERWKVLDIAGHPQYKYDINSGEPLPFEDGEVNNYYTSHTLEHVEPTILPYLLTEIHRTLKVGGRLRVVVPDVQLALLNYCRRNRGWVMSRERIKSAKRHGYPPTPLGCVMLYFCSDPPKGHTRSGHHSPFDWETLVWYCKQAGFSGLSRERYNRCSDVFMGLDFSRHAPFSIYLEAVK